MILQNNEENIRMLVSKGFKWCGNTDHIKTIILHSRSYGRIIKISLKEKSFFFYNDSVNSIKYITESSSILYGLSS